MQTAVHPTPGDTDRLLGVIKTQTEIAKLGLDLGGVMSLVAQRAQVLTNAAGAVVELAEGDDMVYRAVSGIAEPQLGLRLKRSTSMSGLCVKSGQALRCDDSDDDPRVDREACRRVGLRSMIVVPLRHDDAQVGVLKVLSSAPNAFDEADIRILELMSELIAAAMYHAAKYCADELFHKATHDALTGLANRALFYDRLRHGLAQAKRNDECFAVLNLDMDDLKPINDRFGHRAGDAALKELATRLSEASRESDTVARVGGDEFGVILTRVDGRDGALRHGRRLGDSVSAPFCFEDKELKLGASVGLAFFPDDGVEISDLIEKADQAMYQDKRARKQRLDQRLVANG